VMGTIEKTRDDGVVTAILSRRRDI